MPGGGISCGNDVVPQACGDEDQEYTEGTEKCRSGAADRTVDWDFPACSTATVLVFSLLSVLGVSVVMFCASLRPHGEFDFLQSRQAAEVVDVDHVAQGHFPGDVECD